MTSAVRSIRATLALAFVLAPVAPVLADSTHANVPEAAYARIMRSINPRLPESQSRAYATALLTNSQRMHLDPRLVMAVVTVESHWDEHAVSPDGAVGLGQLKPETARRLGVDAWSGKSNLRGITLYLHRLIGIFASSRSAMSSAIASYNAGPIAVENNHGAAPGYAAQHYLAKVLATWHAFQTRLRARPPAIAIATLSTDFPDTAPDAADLNRSQAAYWGSAP